MRRSRWILTLAASTAALVALQSLDPAVARSAGAGLQQVRSTSAAQTPRPPLHLGSRGPRVRALQQRLIALGYLPSGRADGVFGRRTWHAVVAFQGWQRLQRDGVAGPRTFAALASAVRPRP